MVTREVLLPREESSVLPEFPPCSLPLALTQAPRIGLENRGVFCLVCDLDVLKMKRKNKSACSCEYQSLIFEDLKPHKSGWEGRSREKILLLLVPSYSQQRKTTMRGRRKAVV